MYVRLPDTVSSHNFQVLGAAKVSSYNHSTCACVNNTQRCSHCSWLGVSMCNHHSSVMFALYCVNTEIKMQAAHVKYTKDERIFLLILYLCNHVDHAMILAEFENISQNNPLHDTGMLQYCSVSLKKRVQLRMHHNLSGLVWRQCGRIWKMGPPLRWKMRTPPHVVYPQYLNRFAKYSNAFSITFTNPVSFLITLFYLQFAHFFPDFSHMQIRELTFATLCITPLAQQCCLPVSSAFTSYHWHTFLNYFLISVYSWIWLFEQMRFICPRRISKLTSRVN